MLTRGLLIHSNIATATAVKQNLDQLARIDAVTTWDDALVRARETQYPLVFVESQASWLDKLYEIYLQQSDAFFFLLSETPNPPDLDPALGAKAFRIKIARDDLHELHNLVSEVLQLQRLEQEQRDLTRKLSAEYSKLQKREKLLDVVVKERTRELEVAYESLKASAHQALLGFAEAIEAKDPYTKGHCGRVAVYSMALGEAVGLTPADLEVLEFGAFLHDIGKIGVKDSVLLKPAGLDDAEWEHMRLHPVIGSQIASQLDLLKPTVACVRNHHERWDGNGYPDKLKGQDIPLIGRIVCIADAYDAMATDRPYKRALPIAECRAIFQKAAGSQFDPDLVDLWLSKKIMDSFR